MFGFFRKKTAAPFTGEQCSVDISENGLMINGMKLDIPMHMDAAEKILGTPRSQTFRTSSENREFLEQTHGKGMVTKRVNYTWDELGIYCYTVNGKVVHCFGFMLRNDPEMNLKHSPAKMFSGTLTINGEPWDKAILRGDDCEVIRVLPVGYYSVTAEYADPFAGGNPYDGGYNCIEFQLEE